MVFRVNRHPISMRSGRMSGLALLAVLAIASLSFGVWRGTVAVVRAASPNEPRRSTTGESAQRSESPESDSESTPRIEVVHPKHGGLIRTSSQTGSLHAFESADLYAKISGYLKILNVDIGDQVKEGQLLAAIDVPEILKQAEHDKAAVEQAKAMVKQAMAKIETAQAELKASQAVVRKDQAEVERFAASRRFHEKEVTRYKELVHKQAEAQEKLDKELELFEEALAAEHSGQAKVVSSQANVLSAQALVEQYKADLAEAQANVQVGVSNEAKTEVLVDYTRIISPYSGVITYRGFHRGAFIRAAQGGEIHPILTVARTDKFRVVTYIPDRDVPFADVGDRALVTLDALPGEVFEGKVSRFEEAEDPKSRTMRTEIDLPNPGGAAPRGYVRNRDHHPQRGHREPDRTDLLPHRQVGRRQGHGVRPRGWNGQERARQDRRR